MRNIYIFIGLAVVLLLGAILYLGTSSDSDLGIPEIELRTATEDPTLKFNPTTADQFAAEDWSDVLSHYRQWSVYPPNSRPLEEGQEDLIEYRKFELPEQAMSAVQNGQLVDTGAHCHFEPDRHTITADERVLVTLRCSKDDRPVKINVSSAKVTKVGDRGPLPTRGVFAYNDEGKDGDARPKDGTFTFTFAPDPADRGDLSLDVAFTLEGVAPESFTHEMKASFFASPTTPARFTGKIDESLEGGSLVLGVEIDVKKPGWYTVEGNLYDLDERPVAYAREKQKLPPGKQFVRLLYFGKVLRDKKAYGPFRLVGVRGERDNSGIDLDRLKSGTVEEVEQYLNEARSDGPMKEQVPYLSAAFQTQEYKAGDFSDREYDSPAKRERIELLSNFAKNPPD